MEQCYRAKLRNDNKMLFSNIFAFTSFFVDVGGLVVVAVCQLWKINYVTISNSNFPRGRYFKSVLANSTIFMVRWFLIVRTYISHLNSIKEAQKIWIGKTISKLNLNRYSRQIACQHLHTDQHLVSVRYSKRKCVLKLQSFCD